MFSPSPATMAYSQFYGGGGAATQAPTQAASGGVGPVSTGGQGDSAHIAWLGIALALIIVRVLYEMGGKID